MAPSPGCEADASQARLHCAIFCFRSLLAKNAVLFWDGSCTVFSSSGLCRFLRGFVQFRKPAEGVHCGMELDGDIRCGGSGLRGGSTAARGSHEHIPRNAGASDRPTGYQPDSTHLGLYGILHMYI